MLSSPAFLGHDTGGHPENAGRLRAVLAELEQRELLAGRPPLEFGPASREQLTRVHDAAYLDAITAAAAAGGSWLDGDTVVREDSVAVASLAAGAAVAAVDAVRDSTVPRALVLARPPGHHATPARGMGFCLINTVAVAAAHALTTGCQRVFILDWDVHHGNGTQDAFYDSDQVYFCSLHQSPLYPGTGAANERGTGRGEGFTLNLPLAPGGGDDMYAAAIRDQVRPAALAFAPDLVLVSAGFDAHHADPLASMRLTEQGFAMLAAFALELAAATAGGRLVAVLEGGYHPVALARSVATVLMTFDAAAVITDSQHLEGAT